MHRCMVRAGIVVQLLSWTKHPSSQSSLAPQSSLCGLSIEPCGSTLNTSSSHSRSCTIACVMILMLQLQHMSVWTCIALSVSIFLWVPVTCVTCSAQACIMSLCHGFRFANAASKCLLCVAGQECHYLCGHLQDVSSAQRSLGGAQNLSSVAALPQGTEAAIDGSQQVQVRQRANPPCH